MAILNSLRNRTRQKVQGAIQGAQAPQPLQAGVRPGAEGPIMDVISQFSLGSQLPGQSAEAEEQRTNRRANRGVVDGLRARRTASRFTRREF